MSPHEIMGKIYISYQFGYLQLHDWGYAIEPSIYYVSTFLDLFWPTHSQWCVLPISVPLGVGQAPVENWRGSYGTKNVAKKKLVS